MTGPVPITEATLRAAMRDERYWRPNAEQRDYVAWVTEGWQALSDPQFTTPDGQALVFVRAYQRTRGGKPHDVGAHTRSGPPRADATGGAGRADPSGVSAQPGAPWSTLSADAATGDPARVVLVAGRRDRGGLGGPPPQAPLGQGGVRRAPPGASVIPVSPLVPFVGGNARGAAPGLRPAVPPSAPAPPGRTPGDAAAPLRLHEGQQGKHMEGHNNFIPGRSILRADPQRLLDTYAGRGQPVAGSAPPQAGARERFDTGGEVIGIYRHRDGREALTTRGMIHYGNDGAHISPVRPDGWVE